MHPSISRFPNKNLYDGKTIDGPNVKDHYNSYLPGNIYLIHSFILKMVWKNTVVRVKGGKKARYG